MGKSEWEPMSGPEREQARRMVEILDTDTLQMMVQGFAFSVAQMRAVLIERGAWDARLAAKVAQIATGEADPGPV